MKRKCPDCGKKKVSPKSDRKEARRYAKDMECSVNLCIDCVKFYESVDRERMSDHLAGY